MDGWTDTWTSDSDLIFRMYKERIRKHKNGTVGHQSKNFFVFELAERTWNYNTVKYNDLSLNGSIVISINVIHV